MAGLGQPLAGLPNTPANPPVRQAPSAPMDEPDGEEQPNVTPEEQAMYDAVMNNALKVIYTDGNEGAQVNPDILSSLKGSDDPKLNLSMTAVTIVKELVNSAKSAGTEIDATVLFHAGTAIIEELVEVAEAAKIAEYDEEAMEGALYQALDMYREEGTAAGTVNPEPLKAEFEMLKAANEEGRLADLLPGIDSRMGEA